MRVGKVIVMQFDLKEEQELVIHLETAAKINFACHQNSYPILRELRIENVSPESRHQNLQVSLISNPEFILPKNWNIDRIDAQKSISVSDHDVQLNAAFLMSLSDSVKGSLTVRVEQDGQTLVEASEVIELLAHNEWGGAGYMPELLASFCTPNDPAVDQILRSASEILRKAGRKDSLEGYQSGSRERVWEIASAIYSAICNLSIAYSEPPASFENDGQKIRLPGRVVESRVGTCLDTAMLFASAFEQAGLNPIVALPRGHALVGVWLQPESLSSIVIQEAEILRKRMQLKELLLIETTLVANRPVQPFSTAIEAATTCIHPDSDDTFNAAVDIKRARMHRINPIGLTNSEPKIEGPEVEQNIHMALESAPVLPTFDDKLESDTDAPETPQGRIDRWQRRLLDLTLRNPLLNHKAATTSLKLICPEPDRLEDRLAAGDKIAICSVPRPSAQGQDESIHRKRTGDSIAEEYAREALGKKQVLVDLPEAELSGRAVEIYRKAQTALQEGGSNTLYLSLGFLLWKRDEEDDRRFRAPLILLPVTLERTSVRSGIKMVMHDDEPRFNTTLLEMLRKDFSIDIKGLDGALPTDHSGIDVKLVWDTVRAAVKDAPGFEVFEEVVLGHFSFAKYLMWKDLVDRTEALRESPVVRHLIDTPREQFKSDIEFVDGARLDVEYDPVDLLIPRAADSSQVAAIATAEKGKDFVIIGPPGTGKSQTISNMIAHLLGRGKSVLFVSEKTAALEVVYRRLNEAGLGNFCLELHSSKAKKADVLNQFRVCWDNASTRSVDDWKEEGNRLKILRDKLNRVVTHLHKVHRNGLTPHYAIGVKVRDHRLSNLYKLGWASASQHDAAQLKSMREAVDRLAIQVKAIGNISSSPFKSVSAKDWSPAWENQVVEVASRLSRDCQNTQAACAAFCKAVGFELPDQKISRLEALADLSSLLCVSYKKQTAFALGSDGEEHIEALELAVTNLKQYAEAQASLSCAYEPLAWKKLDGESLGRRWKESEQQWFLKRWLSQRAIIKEFQQGGAQGKPNPAADSDILSTLRKHGEEIDRLDPKLAQFRDWKAHNTDPIAAEKLKDLGNRVRVAVGKLVDDTESLIALRSKIKTLLADGNDLLAPDTVLTRSAKSFMESLNRFKHSCGEFESLAGDALRRELCEKERALDVVQDTVDGITRQHHDLKDWCAWQKRRTEAIDLDLLPLVEAIEDGRVRPEVIDASFEAAYCQWWSGAVIGEDEVLRTFSTAEHEIDIQRFREVDTKFQKLTAQYISAVLSGNVPVKDDVKKSSQWGVLRHELQKKTRHKAIRQLMQEIPDVVTTLAPCLMMSPLSVAQYLSADQKNFDVVIFDEASQITVWDAVGAIARGKQVIVTGDPKQMPPTNFFGRNDDGADDEVGGDEADLESILDEMLGAGIPKRTLELHYRSRRESLIAFSNAKYYDNCLVTFPAPVFPDRGVKLVQPSGFYARGGARHNEGEAKAIVAEIVRRLKHEDPAVRNQSIGVVTFNSEQQTLIQNLLDEACKDSSIEWAFSKENVLEPVFVKNLETVQGDERDVILFSITYGPDQSGHVTMNFGPLNRTGGERRLNVAMTRARTEMIVFSTLSPERIELSRTQSLAVAHLKHFLEYAAKGPSTIGSFVNGSVGDFESPFEVAVARGLKERGWQVHPQIGVSAYRVDLGIVNPDAPGSYLAGIECDGAMYHSSAYARERDKIRQGVLQDLGWTLYRVWSTDWWTNAAKALEHIHGELAASLERSRSEQQTSPTSGSDPVEQINLR